MTISTAASKLHAATDNLLAANNAYAEIGAIVLAEQTNFERVAIAFEAVLQAERAEEWASAMLVKAIRQAA